MPLPRALIDDLVGKVNRFVDDPVTDGEQAWKLCPRGDWLLFVALAATDDPRPVIVTVTRFVAQQLPPVVAAKKPAADIVRRGNDLAVEWVAGKDVLEDARRLGFDAATCSSEAILDRDPAVGAATDAINSLCALIELFYEQADPREVIGCLMQTLTATTTASAYQRGAEDQGPAGPDRTPELRDLADFLRAELPMPSMEQGLSES